MDRATIARRLRRHGLEPIGLARRRPLSIVLRAVHVETRQPVFVKILGSGSIGVRRNFLREIGVLTSLDGLPGIPQLITAAIDQRFTFHACRFIRGMTLDAVASSEAGRDLAAILSIANSLAKWLVALHRRGIAHRDLSPDHVFLGADGEITVVDFGMAISTRGLTVLDRGRCERYDLQAFGMVLWEAVCGRPIFPYRNPILREVLKQEIDLVQCARLPPAMSELIVGCLAARSEFTPHGLQPHRGFTRSRQITDACSNLEL